MGPERERERGARNERLDYTKKNDKAKTTHTEREI